MFKFPTWLNFKKTNSRSLVNNILKEENDKRCIFGSSGELRKSITPPEYVDNYPQVMQLCLVKHALARNEKMYINIRMMYINIRINLFFMLILLF